MILEADDDEIIIEDKYKALTMVYINKNKDIWYEIKLINLKNVNDYSQIRKAHATIEGRENLVKILREFKKISFPFIAPEIKED